ncbi:MAG: restriction endonuclease subunit S [Acidobacteria bacterium]|nr:restriction endonuclease subunit S [Acidobacteriota bacterium]
MKAIGVFSLRRAIGNVLYVSRLLAKCAISDHVIRIEPSDIESGYLYAFLRTQIGQELIAKEAYGGTISQVEPKHLASIPVPIGPESLRQQVHEQIVEAYRLRDAATDLLNEADRILYDRLGLAAFSPDDIDRLGGAPIIAGRAPTEPHPLDTVLINGVVDKHPGALRVSQRLLHSCPDAFSIQVHVESTIRMSDDAALLGSRLDPGD